MRYRPWILGLLLFLLAGPVWAARPMMAATITAEALTATARYVLVDLSDTSGYRHTETNGIRLYRIHGNAERREGAWDLHIGLVLENDATDGTAQWLYTVRIENDDQATDDHSARAFDLDFAVGDDGYQLLRVSSNVSVRTVSSELSGNQTWLQNDAGNLADATGATNKSAGAGDLVLEAEEVTDTGALDFTITALYATE